MAYKSVEELNSMGTDGVAREKLILEEKKIKKSLEELDKTKDVEIMYEDEIDSYPVPNGRTVFNGILTTTVRSGTRPSNNTKIVGTRNILETQKVLKVGPSVTGVEVGDIILINVEQWQLRNLNAPVLLLDVEDKKYEYLVLTDRDIKYIM